MLVAFQRSENLRGVSWRILGEKGKRAEMIGTEMALGHPDDLPHDLAQFTVESALGLEFGFWGCVAAGATFKSLQGKKQTKHGKAILRAHLAELDEAEGAANRNIGAWKKGEDTPLGGRLDEMLALWKATPSDQSLVLEWPSGRLVDGPGGVSQVGGGAA